MKNRLISILLAALLIVSLFPLTAAAADIVDSGTCGENLTWTLDSDGLLVISGTGSMTDYGYGEPPYYSRRESIQSAIIESGVTSLGSCAFEGCSSLTSVTIPESVTIIGWSAFSGCRALESVTIPYGVTSIKGSAFQNCSSLTSITIPESVTSIEGSAFEDCSSLTSITIPKSVTSIETQAFYNCSSLISVVIPEGVTTIDHYAFMNCNSITHISLPVSVQTIGYRAFYNCSSLSDVWYSGTVPQWFAIQINSDNNDLLNAKRYYSGVSFVDSGTCGDNLTWTLDENGLLTISGTGPMTDYSNYGIYYSPFYENRSDIKTVVIESGVTSIGKYAFYNCENLTSVTIPESVTSIGGWAFEECSSLTSITIPDSVTSIGSSAFSGCSSLTSVTIQNGVTSIGSSAFSGCSSLTSVTIPDSVTSIGGYACNGCSSLMSITIPSTVTSVGAYAFQDCTGLTEVFYGGDAATWKRTVDASNILLLEAPHIHLNTASPDGHFYSISVPATCEADGYTARTCDCGYEYDRVVTEPSLGHDWTPWATLLEPTATTKGIAVRVCANDPKHVEFKALPTADEETSNPFTDVAEGKFYHDPVLWAISQDPQITTGVTDTTFEPDRSCTRAHVVTFLWRANGCPEPTTTVNPFKDVSASAYYCKAVLWASEQGITTGYSDGTFRPNDECTRGQVVTFLWRAKGQPAPTSTSNLFSDVPAGKYYTTAVLWALENGITTGNTSTTFNPTGKCTRAHVVTFLYRAQA